MFLPHSVTAQFCFFLGLRSLGLGYGLSYLTHRHWLEQGCESIIHAYMKTDNRSRSMSARFGVPLRDYVLLGSAA